MVRKIACGKVVFEIIERSDCWVREEVGPSNGMFCVERSV